MRSLAFLAIIALAILLVVVDMRRRAAETQLAQLTMKYQQDTGNQAQNQQAAQKIVDQVGKLIQLPAGVQPTVATIVDVDALRKRNAFYDKAKNGDYLIVTPDRAILFDAKANVIIDVVPVQIQAPADSSSSAARKAKATGTLSSQ